MIKKSIILGIGLFVVSTLASAEIIGLTVASIEANHNNSGFYDVSFIEGNPIPGPTGCRQRYRYDEDDPAIVALINRSRDNGERMQFTLRDEYTEIRNSCALIGVGTLN